LLLKVLVWGLIAQSRVLSQVIVVVHIASGLVEEILLASDSENSRDIKLLVISPVRSLQMGILFTMAFVVLDEFTAKAGNEFTQLLDFEPRFAPKFLPVVYREDYLSSDTVRTEPGDGPQVETQAIGPAPFPGVGNELEARVNV
jgi:hypothetical protein